MIEFSLKEKQKRLRFIRIHNEPTKAQMRYFWIINAMDMGGSYYYTTHHPNMKEGNPLLPENPSAAQFLLQKGITAPLIAQNFEEGQIIMINFILTAVVLRNHYLYNTTSRCRFPPGGANYHVDGYPVNCL